MCLKSGTNVFCILVEKKVCTCRNECIKVLVTAHVLVAVVVDVFVAVVVRAVVVVVKLVVE